MYRKYCSELERPYPAREIVKKQHISHKAKMPACWEGVGGVHSTEEVMDNKTMTREGTLLHSCLQRG